MYKITLSREKKTGRDAGKRIFDVVEAEKLTECMKKILELRMNNDMAKYSPYEIIFVENTEETNE